jgi:hypothetical protein
MLFRAIITGIRIEPIGPQEENAAVERGQTSVGLLIK